MARPKYQVFISSTFVDLKEYREAATWAILKARHIPAGMETFPAADDRGWKTIQRTIDDSDYYVVLVGARYGSLDLETKISWTEREYRYAVKKGIPVLPFIQRTALASHQDDDPVLQQQLREFKAGLHKTHHVQTFTNTDDLVGKVLHALSNHIQDDEDDHRARPGWYRGTDVPSPQALEEFAKLSAENRRLSERLAELEVPPAPQLELTLQDAIDTTLVVNRNFITLTDQPSKQGPQTYGQAHVTESQVKRNNTIIEVTFSIRNPGKLAVKNVVAEFRCSNCTRLTPGVWHEPIGSKTPWWNDPSEHVYVDGVGVGFIRQRIRQVNAGATEQLVPFFLHLDIAASTTSVIDCLITTENGSPLEGHFVAQIEGEELTLTVEEARSLLATSTPEVFVL